MAKIQHLLDKIRTAIYGKEVRGSLADGLEAINKETEDATEVAVNVEQRQDAVEQQFDDVLNEWTSDKPISNEETIAARTNRNTGENHQTLGQRLDAENKKVSAQLAETEREIRRGYYDGALVSFGFDDGTLTDWTKFKPIFESENVPGCACLVTSLVGNTGRLTWEQARELKSMGWTVCSHTHTHKHNSQLPENEVDFEFRESSRLLKENGLDHDILVYPFGSLSDMVEQVARRYYKMAVDIDTEIPNTSPYLNNYRVSRVKGLSQGGVNAPTLDECKQTVDRAIANGDWIIFEDHSAYDIWTEDKLNELRELIQYIKSKGVPIVNYQTGFELKANVVDMRLGKDKHVRLFRDGTFRASNSPYILSQEIPDINKPITDYELNKITVIRTTHDTAQGFPENTPGILETHLIGAYDWGYQTYTVIRNNRVYKRYWRNGWSDFEKISNNEILLKEKMNSLPGDFNSDNLPKGQTMAFNNFAGGTGYPNGSAGQTIAFKNGNAGWWFDLFKEYNTDRLYFRGTNSDGTNRDWQQVVTSFPVSIEDINVGSITAKYSKDFTTNYDVPSLNVIPLVSWVQPLPIGIVVNAYINTGRKIVIRVANVTDRNIDCGTVLFRLKFVSE